jgi:hypothetical protein
MGEAQREMKRGTGSGLFRALFFVAAMTLFQSASPVRAQERGLSGRTITGTVYFVGGRRAGQSRPFTLIINRLSSPDEVQRLQSALQSGGQDDLLRVLSGMNAGRIQLGTGVGVTANAIIPSSQGGDKLVVLYERTLGFSELRYGTRSQDYKFGYAELYLNRGGDQGMLIPAAKVRLRDGNTWEVEDFGTFPARLMGLQVRGGRRGVR